MASLSFEDVKGMVKEGGVDTVLAVIVDMQGRLMGKRFHAAYFCEKAWEETHCCNYLLATDIEMYTVQGYASTSWKTGYGDYVMKPNLSTLRRLPWLEGTVMVLCDLQDHSTHKAITHCPREILRRMVSLLSEEGRVAKVATELEFFVFEGSYEKNRKRGYRKLSPVSGYNEDYHILQTTKEEGLMRPLRNYLYEAGIPVENTKGEAEVGQEELNISYAEAEMCAEHHTIAKHAVKEMAWQRGLSASFLPKWHEDKVGSSSHIHQSLWDKAGNSLFYEEGGRYGMSKIMENYVAGLMKYARETTYFLAPYVNSYKRLQKNSFAPTGVSWSVDNRTAGFRLCGMGTQGVRIECRMGGSDMNPYLGIASQLAAGMAGIREDLSLKEPLEGDGYEGGGGDIPRTLYEARDELKGSKMLREALGDEVVDHYVRAASWELEDFERVVTDYEIKRGFERA